MDLHNDKLHDLHRLGRSWVGEWEGEGVVRSPQAAESKGREILSRNYCFKLKYRLSELCISDTESNIWKFVKYRK